MFYIIPIMVPSPPLAKIPVNSLLLLDGGLYARSDPRWVLVTTLNNPVGNVRADARTVSCTVRAKALAFAFWASS